MKTTLLRAGALSCALLASTALVSPAMAQSAPPPRFNQVDGNGVDLVTGDYFFSMVEGSIGSGEGALTLARNWAGPAGWTDNWSGTLYWRGSERVAEFGTYSDTFTVSGTTYTSTKANGATLVPLSNGALYTAADGTQITYQFHPSGTLHQFTGPACGRADDAKCVIPVSIRRPNGMTYTLTWDQVPYCAQPLGQVCPVGGVYVRLKTVSSSANYSMTFNYLTDTPGSVAPVANWYVRSGAQFTNLDGAPASLPTVTYSAVSSAVIDVTDTGGQTWRLTTNGSGLLSGIRRPGAGSDTTAISYSGGDVSSVTNEGVTTGYSLGVSGSTGTMTITDAASQVTTVVSDLTKGRPTSVTDPLSRTTSLQYDSSSRPTRTTSPEGNYVGYTYDARGNVTEQRAVAKSGSGLTDIVATASYDSSCSNVVTCNQPNSVTDARGNTTDYTYDSTHGGVLTVTRPAPSGSGDRPQTRYSYTQVTAVTGEPVYMPTGVSACSSGTVASGCVGSANESRAAIAYDTDNLRTTSVTARNGDNSLSATSAFTYDQIGNMLTEDGPLSGSGDTTRYRYDDARRVIGAVGPDPDGGGSLKHRAVRATYTNGLQTMVEQGTVDSQSDGDWAAFSPLQKVEQDYDANARPTVQRLMSGSTTYQLTQTRYDSLGRVRCVAQRMNPSEFASLPSDACTLDTQGSYGPDRITRTSYDNAGQVTKTETGYGVTGVAADEATVTYTDNGQVATVTDANGNTTYFHYSGHDRRDYQVMPSPSTPGSWNWSDYEYYAYDANGNMTYRIMRDGQTLGFSYDTLNRLSAKDLPGSELDVTYGYDLLSRMTSAATSAQTLSFGYDGLGRNTSQAGPHGTVGYAYDLASRRTSMTYADSGLIVGYNYDTASDLTEIRENPSGSNTLLATYVYDDRGRRLSVTRGNATATGWSYDNVSRLTQLQQSLTGTSNDVILDIAYNPAGEIVSNTRSNDSYAYTGHANANVTGAANGLNQLTAVGGTSNSHDARGNVSAIGGSSYGYSSENLLTSAPSSATLGYDPANRLYQTVGGGTTTRFGYDGDQMIAEYNGSNTLQRRYVFGPGTDEPLVWYEGTGTSTRRYFHADERGSVVAVSDGSGNLYGSNPNRYDEYGNAQGNLTGRFGFTGQAWIPEAGLYHYRARAYNPAMGRFMQTDPIGFGGGMNLYAYVGNNPVNSVDPSGLTPPATPRTTPTCTGSRIRHPQPCAGPAPGYSGGDGGLLATATGRGGGFSGFGGYPVCTNCHDSAGGSGNNVVVDAPFYITIFDLNYGTSPAIRGVPDPKDVQDNPADCADPACNHVVIRRPRPIVFHAACGGSCHQGPSFGFGPRPEGQSWFGWAVKWAACAGAVALTAITIPSSGTGVGTAAALASLAIAVKECTDAING